MLSKTVLAVVPYSIRILRRLSAEALEAPLTFQQLRILFLIKDGHGQTEIADILKVSTAAVSKMISGLEVKKFALRSPGKDRRSLELSLTSQGKKVLGQVSGKIERRLENKLKLLSKQELEELKKGLTVLEKLMGFVNEA